MTKPIDVPGVGLVEFPDSMSDSDITEAIKNKILPQYAPPKPESRMPKPVEGSGGAAFGVYRPAGPRPESQQDRQAALDMPLQTVRGVASNVTMPLGIPGSVVNAIANAPRTAQQLYHTYANVKSQLSGAEPLPAPNLPAYQEILPGIEWSNTLVPGPEPTSPAGRLAFGAGQMAGGPIMPKAAAAEWAATKSMLGGAGDIVGGALGRGTGYIAKPGEAPKGYQIPSARIPLSNEFTSPEDWAAFQRGELPYGQFPQTKPIQELPSNKLEKAALMASGGEIPAKGQGMRAFGERLGETYRNPITAALDIGSLLIPGNPGIPLLTAGRGALASVQGAADAILAKKGFDPSLPAKMEAYKSGQIPMPGTPPVATAGPVAPTPNYPLTVQGPGQQLPPSSIPMPAPQRNVNIEGQSFTIPRDINVANSQTARAPQTPAQVSMQAAASKIQPAPQAPVAGPVQPQQQVTPPVATPAPTTNVAPAATPIANAPKSTEIKNYGDVGLRDIKKIEQIAKETGEPTSYTFYKKGEGNTKVTLNKDISFKPDPDLKLTSAKEFHKGDKEFTGTLASTGEPVTVKAPKGGNITVLNKDGIVIKEFDTKGNLISEPKKKAPSNVSQMLVGEPKPTGKMNEALVSKRSFNSDLQKYRYGSEKNPLTMDEFNHLKQSDFLEHQNTRDILMDMRPDLTEYSIWYKDKTGKIHNVQTHGGELDKFRKIK